MDHDEVRGGDRLLANAGVYKVRLALGTAKVEQDVEIAAGKLSEQKIALGAGSIEASGVFATGGPAVPDSAAIELRKGEPGVDGKHEWITNTYGTTPQFKVPAGKYLVVFTKDYAEGSAPVEVTAGAMSKVEVSLDGGYLAVTGPAGQPLKFSPPRRTSPASGHTLRRNMAARSTRPLKQVPTMWLPREQTARFSARRTLK